MSKILGKWKDLFKGHSGKKSGSPIAEGLKRRGKHGRDTQSLLLGTLIASGAATARALYAKPGIKSTLESVVDKFFTGKWEEYESIEAVKQNAAQIIELLKSKKVGINKLAVDGLPGSGKSTLARALSEQLGFRWQSLDGMNLNKPVDFSQGRTVYEHYRLLRTQEVDNFDALIYIDDSVKQAKEKILHRKRQAIIVDVYDFNKLKQIGDKAFAICDGIVHNIPDTNINVKIKPKNGFKAYENITLELSKMGVNPEGLSKEQLLFLAVDGKAREGLKAYINTRAYSRELLTGLTAGLREFFRIKKDD